MDQPPMSEEAEALDTEAVDTRTWDLSQDFLRQEMETDSLGLRLDQLHVVASVKSSVIMVVTTMACGEGPGVGSEGGHLVLALTEAEDGRAGIMVPADPGVATEGGEGEDGNMSFSMLEPLLCKEC